MTDDIAFDAQFTAVLQQFVEVIRKEFPEVQSVMDSAKRGELDESAAMTEILRMTQSNPQMAAKLMESAASVFQPTRAESGIAQVPRGELAEVGDTAFWSGVGLPRLNPLMEAALAERAQFDGDIPELRTGPLLPGVVPAVPVKTFAKSPEAIGQMLSEAAQKVREAQDAADAKRAAMLERVAEKKALAGISESAGALAVMAQGEDAIDFLVQAHGSASTDPDIYRRGELPKPLEVARPTGGALIRMTPAERREKAWRFLSTSQGRRTAVETLRCVVRDALAVEGLSVELREYDPRAKIVPKAFHEWKVNLSGRGSMQPAFNVIDTAGRALAKALGDQIKRNEGTATGGLYLEVVPVDTVDVRAVGWAARLTA